MLGLTDGFPGLASPLAHAHEMLFGFALGVVAGNQLGPKTVRALALLFAAWLLARVTFVMLPGSAIEVAANAAFPAALVAAIAPRLFGSARSGGIRPCRRS